MPDPCPLPSMLKKRGLNEKERLLYAPMSDVGGLLYDKDAVYIDVPSWKVQNTPKNYCFFTLTGLLGVKKYTFFVQNESYSFIRHTNHETGPEIA